MDLNQETKIKDNKEIYSYEQILEMLCGNEYYTPNQTNYVYYNVNKHLEGYEEKAEEYLKLCLEDTEKLKKGYSRFLETDENKNIE